MKTLEPDPSKSVQPAPLGFGVINLERLEWNVGIMGAVGRNAITGCVNVRREKKVMEEQGDLPDCSVIDLWKRKLVTGSPQDLDSDMYLFRPHILGYRTWIYHYLFKHRVVVQSSDENAMIKATLDHMCIDGPISGGRWTPAMAMVPFSVGVALTGDRVLTSVAVMILNFMIFLAGALNSPEAYRFMRPLTVIPRIAYYGVMLAGMLDSAGPGPGFILSLIAMLVDIIAGDFRTLLDYRFTCCYTIEKVLPNRVYVCRRHGAADYERKFGVRGNVHEKISGKGVWDNSCILIADIHGIITELRPMGYADWFDLLKRVERTEQMEKCYGIGIYDNTLPDTYCLDAVEDYKRTYGMLPPPDYVLEAAVRPQPPKTP